MQWEVQLNSIRQSSKSFNTLLSHSPSKVKTFNRFVWQMRERNFAEDEKKLRKITLAIRLERSSLTTSRNLLKSHILILLFPIVCKKKLFVQIAIRLMKRSRSSEQRMSESAVLGVRAKRSTNSAMFSKSKAPHIRKFLSRFKCLRNLLGECLRLLINGRGAMWDLQPHGNRSEPRI